MMTTVAKNIKNSVSLPPARLRTQPTAFLAGGRLSREFITTALIPLTVLIFGTVLIQLTGFDLVVSRIYYDASLERFPLKNAEPWFTTSNLGCYPGLVLGVAALITGLVATCVPRSWVSIRAMQRPGLILGGIMLIGPGMLVTVLVKDIWGRPRPEQTIVFGGDMQYRSLFEPVAADFGAHSFPCGHASIGFYLMAPAFLFWRTRPRWANAFLALGFATGLFIGYCRLIQGSHFFSDVMWSAAIVYFTGLTFHYLFCDKSRGTNSLVAEKSSVKFDRRASLDFAMGKVQVPLLTSRHEVSALQRAA
jgi:membrane-associated PAP2 superfamily phosphatase